MALSPATIIAICDEGRGTARRSFPRKSIFRQWNFPSPLATKAGDAKQDFRTRFQQTFCRAGVFIALPLDTKIAWSDFGIAKTASVLIKPGI
jgi:hypothetical protein